MEPFACLWCRGWLSSVWALSEALDEQAVGDVMRATAPPLLPPDYHPERKTIDTLAMVRASPPPSSAPL